VDRIAYYVVSALFSLVMAYFISTTPGEKPFSDCIAYDINGNRAGECVAVPVCLKVDLSGNITGECR